MPVRIVFRGLILFRVEGKGTPEGQIVADLVDVTHPMTSPLSATSLPSTSSTPSSGSAHSAGSSHSSGADPANAAGHSHRHFPEIQVYTSNDRGIDLLELNPGRDIRFVVPGSNHFVTVHPSYDDHCPKLSQILAESDDAAFRDQPWQGTDDRFVRATITINRGTIRVKDVVTWDAGAFPLTDDPKQGFRTATPALVSFLGSSVHGHMASECVIDIDDVDEVLIADSSKPAPSRFCGQTPGNPRAPERTVEILVTNFPSQQERALPWSFHFLWLFRAARYTPQPIPNELREFDALAREYLTLAIRGENKAARIQAAIDAEIGMLGADRAGFPIPYLDPKESLTRLEAIAVRAIADPWNLPLCPQGDNTKLGGP